MPIQLDSNFWKNWLFWVGLLFVTFPLNFLIYGLNDFTDGKANSVNPRKGNFLFGAKLPKKELAPIPRYILFVTVPFLGYFFYVGGMDLFILVLFMIVANIIYNYKPFRLKARPPFDILMQIGYAFIALFSILLNDLEMLSWQTFLCLCVLTFLTQISFEILDIDSDIIANRKTTAVLLGRRKSKLLLLFLLLFEIYIFRFWFDDWVLFSLLSACAVWLVLDVFFLFKKRPYTVRQMKLMGVVFNLFALFSLGYSLYSGILLHPNF